MAGCGKSTPGVVQGEVFLAEGLGKEVNLARISLRLLQDEAEIDSALVRICPSRGGTAAPAAAVREQAWRQRARVLGARALKTVAANTAAQFAIDSIEPGRYRLWADTLVDGKRWTWLQRLTVRAGDTVRIDLSNANSDEDPFRCRV